jgi:signal transduction histidine kinase
MKKLIRHAVAGIAFLGLLVTANEGLAADRGGTAAEAKMMIDRAIAAIKMDKTSALASFTAGAKGFKDRDLYVFCGGPDGLITGHGGNPALVGRDLRKIIDKNGNNLGELFYATAAKGKINIVEYVWPRPGETKPAPKRSYVTRINDQMCGVGYYK